MSLGGKAGGESSSIAATRETTLLSYASHALSVEVFVVSLRVVIPTICTSLRWVQQSQCQNRIYIQLHDILLEDAVTLWLGNTTSGA